MAVILLPVDRQQLRLKRQQNILPNSITTVKPHNRSTNKRVQCQPAAGTYPRRTQIKERGDCIADGSSHRRQAPIGAQTGGVVGQNAVENNSVGISYSAWRKDQTLMKENYTAYSQLRAEQLQAIDFIPVIEDIKGFAEAETKGDYFFATVGIIPLYGDAARKIHQAEKDYQAVNAAKNTEKMKAAINQALS